MPLTATQTDDEVETQGPSTPGAQAEDEDIDPNSEADDGDNGTDQDDDATDDDDSDDGADDEGDEDDSDPELEARIQARITAAEAAAEERGRQSAIQERREQNRELTVEEIKGLFPAAMRDARATAQAIKLTVGDQEVTLSKEQIDAILKPFDSHNNGALQRWERLALSSIEDVIYDALPEAEHESFTEAVTGKQLADWMPEFAERQAFRTKAFKGIKTVDELLEHAGPALKADVAKRDLDQYKQGRTKGRKDPPGEPDADTRNNSGSGDAEWRRLSAGYGAGTLSDSDEAKYRRLRSERESARSS